MDALDRWTLIATAVLAACAPHGAGTSPGPSAARSRDLNVLRADEIKTVSVATAYDAVARLRPSWLRRRGRVSVRDQTAGAVVVYINDMRQGGANVRLR